MREGEGRCSGALSGKGSEREKEESGDRLGVGVEAIEGGRESAVYRAVSSQRKKTGRGL